MQNDHYFLSSQDLTNDSEFIENERTKADMAFVVPKLANKLNGKRKKISKFEKKLHREMKMMDNEFHTVDSFVSNFRSQQESAIAVGKEVLPTITTFESGAVDVVVGTGSDIVQSKNNSSSLLVDTQLSPVSSPPPSPSVTRSNVVVRSGMKHRKFSNSMTDKNWQAHISSYEESLKNITQETAQQAQSWINTRKVLWALILLFVLVRYWFIVWACLAFVLRL
mmetsp:Transcript_1600/g.2110  ORF Transcript_1600/g.2110 Transcript_1600/m.2110 type:complete len:223 (+) Transcript_1600:89-757(+)